MKSYEEKAYSALRRIKEENEIREKKKRAITRTLTPVMSLCLASLIGICIWRAAPVWESTTPVQDSASSRNENNADSISNTAGPADSISNSTDPADSQHGVNTDPVRPPEGDRYTTADMRGCLVYKGNIYVQLSDFYTYNSAEADHLGGEYVGEAKQLIVDCWPTDDVWTTEFASNYSGPVYKVKGYSEDFRLCIYVNAGGKRWLQILENYDETVLNTGADLFEERLHITGNVQNVTYITHNDWKTSYPQYVFRELTGVTDEQLDSFFDELCDSPIERIDYNSDFYQKAEEQGHLRLNMKDGTLVEMRLIEGGYVGYENFGWIFVKMPGELFDLVFSACR